MKKLLKNPWAWGLALLALVFLFSRQAGAAWRSMTGGPVPSNETPWWDRAIIDAPYDPSKTPGGEFGTGEKAWWEVWKEDPLDAFGGDGEPETDPWGTFPYTFDVWGIDG